jgi:uncharacterized protein (DUF362 family)
MKISPSQLLVKKSNKKLRAPRFVTPKQSIVSKSKSLKKALEKINGLDWVKKGCSALVKPNINSDDKFPGTSNPVTLRELILLLQKEGAERIVVGDRSSVFWEGTERNAERVGIKQAVEKTGAEMIYFKDYAWIKSNGFWVTEKITGHDFIINFGVLKTHSIAGITLSMKNLMGITHPRTRLWMHASSLNKKIARLNALTKPVINILDGTKCFIDGGPATGVLKHGKTILASTDRVALDVAGVRELQRLGSKSLKNLNPWEHGQIKEAVNLKLGVDSEDRIRTI